METANDDGLRLGGEGGKTLASRLILGTGKFSSTTIMAEAIQASNTEMVTMALRRIDLSNPNDDFMDAINKLKVVFLPNTSGARNAKEAIRFAETVRKATGNEWLKLEVTPEPRYLLPSPTETLTAARELSAQGFKIMPYINADPVLAKELEEAGCVCVMPLGSPIGSNQGLQTAALISIIIEQSNVPVIVDAGIGAPSHAAQAMEMGADAVLVNTAIATAKNPVLAAEAFREAVLAGRKGFLAQIRASSKEAKASSPLTGFLH